MGFDCVVIPGAVKMTTPFASVPNQICGGKSVGLVTAAGKTGKTICSKFSLLFCCRDVVYYLFPSFLSVLKRFLEIVVAIFSHRLLFTTKKRPIFAPVI